MKILFVTPSYKPAFIYGGPAVSVSELAEALAATGHLVTVYTTTANGKKELDVERGAPVIVNGVTVYYFSRQTGDHTHISFGLWKKLNQTINCFDVVTLQSWWSLLILGAGIICKSNKKTFFVSPRGMLSSYSFKQQNSVLKKILHKLIGRPLLKKSYLHATTELEWQDCKQVIPEWKGFILPNLVSLPEMMIAKQPALGSGAPISFGFLGRVDHKKGLDLLFEALAKISFDFQLKIAGTGEEKYIQSLKTLARTLGINERLSWCGWIGGEQKFDFLQTIDVFVLTSYNENFANSVIESLGVGTAVLVSRGVGLADYVESNKLGWACDTNVKSIKSALEIINQQKEKIGTISTRAPHLIQKDFNHLHLANQYRDAYERFSEHESRGQLVSG